VERRGGDLLVDGMEAIDGTPIVDVKPVLERPGER
jgi:tRNA (Thr-GGU) A37 N-methylase